MSEFGAVKDNAELALRLAREAKAELERLRAENAALNGQIVRALDVAQRHGRRHSAEDPLIFATTAEIAAVAAAEATGTDRTFPRGGHVHAGTGYSAGASQAHTTVTTQWNSQAGTAREVLVWDGSGWVADYLTAIDVMEPAQVLTFTVQPAAAGYPDDTSGSAMVASSGTDTPRFAMTYQGTATAATIDILSETYAGSPEVNPSDYPATVLTPFTSLDGPAINRGAAVSESVTFRITATVSGQSKTKDVTLTYLNERMWGISAVDDIDTSGEIDTFRTAQSKELSNSSAKTFAVTLGAAEYAYYIVRTALGVVDTSFYINPPGPSGGFTKVGSAISWSNPRSFAENYDCWRSDNPNLGAITVQVL